MGKVMSGLAMSLDGFIAAPNDGPGNPLGEGGMRLFDWYSSGDIEYVVPSGEMMFKVSKQSAEMLREAFSSIGAIVTGRRTFDITNGWGGKHPLDAPSSFSPTTSRRDGTTKALCSHSSPTVSRARSKKRKRSPETKTSPWARRASRSNALGRGFSTRYTWISYQYCSGAACGSSTTSASKSNSNERGSSKLPTLRT